MFQLYLITFFGLVVTVSSYENNEIDSVGYLQKPINPKPIEDGVRMQNIHIPGIFKMDLRRGGLLNVTDLDLSILFDLVRVNLNRKSARDGSRRGPVKVTVFGIPIFNKET